MSLEEMGLRDLVRDLVDISNLVDEAQETQSIHAPPEVRARGKAQLPILRKCEQILSEEWHRRFGCDAIAEVAFDAMREYVMWQRREGLKHKALADLFGPLESQEEIEEREAEEREALGCTIADIEEAERKVDAAFEVLHPEVAKPAIDFDTWLLHDRGPHESQQARFAEANRAMQETLRATGADSAVCLGAGHTAAALEFHKLGECIRIPVEGDYTSDTPKTLLHIDSPTHKLEVTSVPCPDPKRHKPGEPIRYSPDPPPVATTTNPEELPPFSLGLPKCLQGEDHDPVLWAMKQAAWSSLQRVQTHTLVEYMKLWLEKHHDYGPENHAIWGCQGAIIRATDKLMRLKGHYFDGRMMLTDKTEDDWLDLIGYGLIGLVIERGQWPVTTLETVLEDMKAKCVVPYESLTCPHCGSEDTFIWQVANVDPAKTQFVACGLQCEDCDREVRGEFDTRGGLTLRESVVVIMSHYADRHGSEEDEYEREHD